MKSASQKRFRPQSVMWGWPGLLHWGVPRGLGALNVEKTLGSCWRLDTGGLGWVPCSAKSCDVREIYTNKVTQGLGAYWESMAEQKTSVYSGVWHNETDIYALVPSPTAVTTLSPCSAFRSLSYHSSVPTAGSLPPSLWNCPHEPSLHRQQELEGHVWWSPEAKH